MPALPRLPAVSHCPELQFPRLHGRPLLPKKVRRGVGSGGTGPARAWAGARAPSTGLHPCTEGALGLGRTGFSHAGLTKSKSTAGAHKSHIIQDCFKQKSFNVFK